MILNRKQRFILIFFLILLAFQLLNLSYKLSRCTPIGCGEGRRIVKVGKTTFEAPRSFRSQSSIIQGAIFCFLGETLLFGILFYLFKKTKRHH